MSDESEGGGFLEGAEEFALSALDPALEVASEAIAGAEDLPVIGGVVGGVEVGIHGATAISDGLEGDWEGAADETVHAGESLLSAATGGAFGMLEGGLDMINSATGGGEDTTAHAAIMAMDDTIAQAAVDSGVAGGVADAVADAGEYLFGDGSEQ